MDDLKNQGTRLARKFYEYKTGTKLTRNVPSPQFTILTESDNETIKLYAAEYKRQSEADFKKIGDVRELMGSTHEEKLEASKKVLGFRLV